MAQWPNGWVFGEDSEMKDAHSFLFFSFFCMCKRLKIDIVGSGSGMYQRCLLLFTFGVQSLKKKKKKSLPNLPPCFFYCKYGGC